LGAPPLIGIAHLEPGGALHGPTLDEKTLLWSPAAVIRAARRRPWASRQDLRQVVDACVRALAVGEDRILCEISGGLDSAIVATSLASAGLGPHGAVNFYRDEPEADERIYAQAVADRVGAPLRTIRREVFALTVAGLERSARAARPNFNALDPDYDAGLVAALDAAGTQALFTGHGGDTVFFQVAASTLATELLRGAPCEGSRVARLEEVARRTRRSLWSLALEALTLRPSRLSIEGQLMRKDAARRRQPGPSHAWLADLAGISAAKRQQITALASNLNANGATERGARARIVHPLLAQPVVELCLAIPAPVLSAGEQERSFAREAFAERLPRLVVERRSKGDISVFLGRSLAASADFLRDFLLNGRLVAEGLIDAAEMDGALEPQALVWKDASREILAAATLEAWVRHWEGRIAADLDADEAAASGPSAGAGMGPKASVRKAKAR
jgi:asparagine synthase (glutamine-hydrolysing)